jgi:hypothetical protein
MAAIIINGGERRMTPKLVGFVVLFLFSLIGILSVSAVSVDKKELPCLACHEMELGAHNGLGEGDFVCQVCHDGFLMKPHSLDGTILTDENISDLCEGCHHERFSDWVEDLHGTHGLNYEESKEIDNCIFCHDPHVPDLPEITPLSAPHPPEHKEDLSIWIPPAFVLLAGMVFATVGINKIKGEE